MFTDTYVAYRFETWGPDISKILDNLKKPTTNNNNKQTTTTQNHEDHYPWGRAGGVLCSCKKGGELIMINHFLDGG